MAEIPHSSLAAPPRPAILHVSQREVLRPLRDQVLRVSGYKVESVPSPLEAHAKFMAGKYDLVLIDVEGERGVPLAEQLCSEIKTAKPGQLVAFVCNWRIANQTDCPDDVVRTEFDPSGFVSSVGQVLARH